MKFHAQIIKDDEIILRPLYSSDAEQMRKLKQNTDYSFEVKNARNVRFHNKFFALIRIGFENQEKHTSDEVYRGIVTMRAGHYNVTAISENDNIVTLTANSPCVWIDKEHGRAFTPKSIAFDKMSQDEFEELFERVLDVISKDLGSDRQDIIDNLKSFE